MLHSNLLVFPNQSSVNALCDANAMKSLDGHHAISFFFWSRILSIILIHLLFYLFIRNVGFLLDVSLK